MKLVKKLILIGLCFVVILLLFNYANSNFMKKSYDSDENGKKSAAVSSASQFSDRKQDDKVVICVVVCGDRLDESLTMMKSALIFAKRPLHFIVITDEPLIPAFDEKLSEWRYMLNVTKMNYSVRPITFPKHSDSVMWRKLFKPCAAQRLFLPTVLNDTDAVLYVDTDTIFLAPPEVVWDNFKSMNSSQLAALSPEHEDPNTGWYNRFARHPYYGKLGVNSGVMLMNLTRMREFKWSEYVIPIHKEYQLKITWGDQDIINIIFHYHPEKLYIYSCRYNYRPDHCMYMSVCSEAEKNGALVLHGSRGTFHSEKQPPFRAVYRAMQEYRLNTDPFINLLLPIKNYLALEDKSSCGKIWKVFVIQPELYLGFES